MRIKETILAMIPPAVVLVAIVLVASCQPAAASPSKSVPVPCLCNDNIAIPWTPRAATPDIVKVVAVALIAGIMLQDEEKRTGF